MRKDVAWLACFVTGGLLARLVTVDGKAPGYSTGAPTETEISHLRRSLSELDRRVAEEASATAGRFELLEARVDEHSARLSAVPGTEQIVSAVEQALMKAMAPVEQRLAGQGQAIDVLKKAVGQTDSLIERLAELAKNTAAQRRSA